MRKFACVAVALCLAATAAFAEAPKGTAAAPTMANIKAEMAKCAVCKNMAAHWDELAPVMTMEVVNLNDGIVIDHGVTDPAKVTVLQSSCDAAGKAGAACMNMTDAQAKTELCPFCQEIRSAVKAGAKLSSGHTKDGSLMVMTSSDPKVQSQISAIGQKCAMMSQQASR
jgi:hypothetical protein